MHVCCCVWLSYCVPARSWQAMATFHRTKELVKAAGTRFGTNTLVGKRLLELKTALQQTVVDPDYVAQNYKDLPDDVEVSNCGTQSRENKGGTAKALVLDDVTFWPGVDAHVRVTEPIYKLLRRHDSSAPTVGKVYHGFYTVGEHLKAVDVPYKEALVDAFDARWAYGHVDIIAAAYALDPEYINHDHASNAEVTEGLLNTVEKMAILCVTRELQKEDGRFTADWDKRAKLIEGNKNKQQTYEHYPKYPTKRDPKVKAFCTKVNAQLAIYRGKKGIFGREWIFDAAEQMPAYLWWDSYGGSVPELQYVARLVLAQPGSASICERINSEFAFVQDARRNRLSHFKANKLVGLFHNLRLMMRMKKVDYAEPAVAWTADEDHSGVTKFGIANYI